MILQIMTSEGLSFMRDKATINACLNKYQNHDSNAWIEEVCDQTPFINTKYDNIKDITLDTSAADPKDTDFENIKRVYSGLSFLSDSSASDERIWAALSLGPFYEYVKYRWKIETVENIYQHFYFGFSSRRSLTRNAIARLWWIGRLTYDKDRSDPFELTKLVSSRADFIMHFIERNTSNNIHVMRPFLEAILEAGKEGIDINTDDAGELAKYLNLLGGMYILDFMPEVWIKEKIKKKIDGLVNKTVEIVDEIEKSIEDRKTKSRDRIILENQTTKQKIVISVNKNKFLTEPKSLIGLEIGASIKIRKEKYLLIGIM